MRTHNQSGPAVVVHDYDVLDVVEGGNMAFRGVEKNRGGVALHADDHTSASDRQRENRRM
jgi:hypothetical protein